MTATEARPFVLIDADELEGRIEAAVRRALDERRATGDTVWLDTAAAAELLGVHPRTVTKLAKSGELPSSRIGKLWRFRRRDIEAFLDDA